MPLKKIFNSKIVILIVQLSLGIFLIIMLAVLLVSTIATVTSVHRYDALNPRLSLRRLFIRHNQPGQPPITDINNLAPWMTFRYINTVFSLPINYLRDQLKITDPRYPDISLSKYANNQKLNQLTLIDEVKKIVSSFTKPPVSGNK